ncbi:SDR family oxidoreductase [Nocardia pseudobrasiliensis]|uniref:Ketoacyl-synthetase-like protein n=1 Tax=Nocardia pseudobrasiliensis TaxID=45979 RepID=A0A370IBG4_9NOCA|nr:SDR family oxidoreductase [Nocardia pseudobrasiliensis]RDI68047.1 ketoacyl-synthetase-like protein [Nocardia pseudobrasiliensis]
MQFDGKIALVTGGARSVGRAIALRLAAEGALVVINHFRSPEAARATKAAIEAAGGRAHIIRASVANAEQRERMFDEIAAEFGALDILVNNAADGRLALGPDVDETMLDRALETNLKGGLGCSRRALALMKHRPGANIVNVSTLGGGQFVMSGYLACGPAKAAVEAMTRYLAVEFAEYGIRVNTAAAGMLKTPVAEQFPDAAAMQQAIIAATPLRRLGTPEELAGIVAFLASSDASWVTGQILLADGGLSTGAALLSPPRESSPDPNHAAPQDDEDDSDAVAIVGMGVTVSGANGVEEFWGELVAGDQRFVHVPQGRWDNENFYSPDRGAEDKSYSRHSAFITDFVPHPRLAAELDAAGRGTDEVESTTLWLRDSVVQALDSVARRPGDRFGFLVGYTADGNQHAEEATVVAGLLDRAREALRRKGVEDIEARLAAVEARLRTRYPRSVIDAKRVFPHQVGAGAMAGLLPADTEMMMIDTACSSSLYAVDLGLEGLLAGRYDIAVCGGAFAVGPRGSVLFAKLQGLSERGEVRSFDKSSDGVLFSDGAAAVVLKTLRRARADGDRILGVVKAFGASSDGKGKAIYAPSAAGQELAIRRARTGETAPDWVVAHATGTPAGDAAEFASLRATMSGSEPVRVTSNKSVIGHTGWAAGTTSLIQVLLGFERELIPPQHRFDHAPAEFMIDSGNLEIPKSAVPWPAGGQKPRVAAVSGFGFGGTNAHLVIEEPPAPGRRTAARIRRAATPAPGRLAVVAVASHLPGASDPAEWLAQPTTSFGDHYPLPTLDEVKLPPGLMRAIDRCQLMILACARDIHTRLGTFWAENRAEIGVLLGHFGETRNATLYATRCYLDDAAAALRADPALADQPWLEPMLADIAAEVRALTPPATENTFPGMMPNVIPARVSNYFGLNGLNMTVDTGFTAALSAIDVAARYLRTGALRMALVGGINGNTTAEQRALLGDLLPADAPIAEGAFLLAMTTEETAKQSGLSILGFLDPVAADTAGDIECGARTDSARPNFLGGEGAFGVLAALRSVASGGEAIVRCHGEDGAPDAAIRVSGPDAGRSLSTGVDSHAWELAPEPGTAVRPPIEFLPDATTILLVEDPDVLRGMVISERTIVLSSSRLPRVSPEVVAELLKDVPHARHLRLVADLSGAVDTDRTDALRGLHDLWFLVAQHLSNQLAEPDASTVALLTHALTATTPHPYVGLFTGAIKVAALERPRSTTFALVTDGDFETGRATVATESMLDRCAPVTYYAGGARYRARLTVLDDARTETPRLEQGSVIVAVGGGRGITAELSAALARDFGGRFFVLGSTELDAVPARYLDLTDAEFAAAKREYMRDRRTENPAAAPRELNAEFERIAHARTTLRNLRRIQDAGATAVEYLPCDVRDAYAVEQAMDRIHTATGRIDLLINAAGLNRPAPIPVKDFGAFRAIRDTKLLAYTNLVAALSNRPPRIWCNFGSLLGVTGQIGEVDYASANDFLGTAALAAAGSGRHEFTIGWTLWGEVGLGANELTKAYFDRTGQYSNMSTEEGVHHFVRQLQAARPSPYVAHLGTAEYGAVDALLPGFLGPTPRPYYLDRRVAGGVADGRAWSVYEHTFDLRYDGYLSDHRVNGVPTLPGAFVTEIALEAARALVPTMRVHAFEDVTFHHFLKVYAADRPVLKRIRAEVLRQRDDPGQARVGIEVTGDVVAPDGTVLVRDRVHFTATVLMAATVPPAPHWTPWYSAEEQPVVDPYHRDGSPVLLTGVFESTRATRLHPLGKRSTYDPRLAPDDPTFSRFRVPVVLLDGLLRTGVLSAGDGAGRVPVAAPLRIDRLDLYEHTNDARVASDGPIDLYAVATDGPDNRFAAVRPDGRIVLTVAGLHWTTTGYLKGAE